VTLAAGGGGNKSIGTESGSILIGSYCTDAGMKRCTIGIAIILPYICDETVLERPCLP
jgi:hypothetical protein